MISRFRLPLLLALTLSSAGVLGQISGLDPGIDSVLSIARTAMDDQQWPRAQEAILQAEQGSVSTFGEASLEYAESVYQHGRLLRFMGDNPEAETAYRKSLNLYATIVGEEHPAYAQNLLSLGVLLISAGRYEEAEPIIRQCVDIRRKVFGEHDESVTMALKWMVESMYRRGDFAHALEEADAGWSLLADVGMAENPEAMRMLFWKALLLDQLGRYEESEQVYLQLLDYRMRVFGPDHPETAMVLNNLGLLYWEMGRFADSESRWAETLRIREQALGENHPLTIRTAGNMGIFYVQTGNYEKAEIYLSRNLKGIEATNGKDHPDYARALSNLSSLYQATNQLEKAEPLIREGVEIIARKQGKDHPDYAIAEFNLGSLEMELGKYEDAQALLLDTERIRRMRFGDHHFDLGLTLRSLGDLAFRMGDLTEAERRLSEATHILEGAVGEDHPDVVFSLFLQAALAEIQGYMEAAAKLYSRIAGIDRDAIQKALYHLSDTEILQYMSLFRQHQNRMMAFALKSGLPELAGTAYDHALFLKGFLLFARKRMVRIALNDPKAREIYARLRETHGQLAKLMAESGSQRDSSGIAGLSEQANQLEKEFGRAVGRAGKDLEQVHWPEVRSALQPDEVAVEFVDYQPASTDSTEYLALLLKPDSDVPQLVPLFPESELAELLEIHTERRSDYVNDIYAYADRGLSPASPARRSLFEMIWAPLANRLSGVKTVYVAPTGILHRINLGAIPVSEDSVLSDRHKIVLLSSTRQLVTGEEDQPDHQPEGALVLGGIFFDADSTMQSDPKTHPVQRGSTPVSGIDRALRANTWNYLTWTAKEAMTISGIIQDQGITTTTLEKDDASEEAFKQWAANRHQERIIHIATHGFFFPDPEAQSTADPELLHAFESSDDPMMRSGLVLAHGNFAWVNGEPLPGMEDGILTAYEISQMDLSNTELVVLSACETGLGDIEGNEGVYGLQRAFKIAGAKYLIMSLWQVPDRETMAFMTTFYRNWLEDKMTIPDAFRKTQLEMRDRFFNPYAWAGFVLVE